MLEAMRHNSAHVVKLENVFAIQLGRLPCHFLMVSLSYTLRKSMLICELGL